MKLCLTFFCRNATYIDNAKACSMLTLVLSIVFWLTTVTCTCKHVSCTNFTFRVSVHYHRVYMSNNKDIFMYNTNLVEVSLLVSSCYNGN